MCCCFQFTTHNICITKIIYQLRPLGITGQVPAFRADTLHTTGISVTAWCPLHSRRPIVEHDVRLVFLCSFGRNYIFISRFFSVKKVALNIIIKFCLFSCFLASCFRTNNGRQTLQVFGHPYLTAYGNSIVHNIIAAVSILVRGKVKYSVVICGWQVARLASCCD